MLTEKYIRINSVSVKKKEIAFRISCSKRIQKYFFSNTIFVEYDNEIDKVSKSLLTIPAVSTLLPIAWATGANLYIEDLDKAFLKSLDNIKPVMKTWHPTFSFRTQIIVKKEVMNKSSQKKYGLLFSGGVDSVVSYIRNKAVRPQLISIWGINVKTCNKLRWKNLEDQLIQFADKEKTPMHFIKSNILEIINDQLLSVEFGRSWWVRVSHGLATIGLCAPITVTENIGTLLIASTRSIQHPNELRYPLGSSPLIDNKLSWANTKIIHDCYQLNRQQKIRYILKPFTEKEYFPKLHVCTGPGIELNCNQCHKCLHTIVGLTLEGIDPNKCGFKITEKTLDSLKKAFLNHEFELFEHDFISPRFYWRTDDWKEIQAEISQSQNSNLYNSQQFFNWLKGFDLQKYGTEMEQRMTRQRLFSVIKYHFLGCTLASKSVFPETAQKEAQKIATSILNSLKTYTRKRTFFSY